MITHTTSIGEQPEQGRLHRLSQAVEHCAHLLPVQAPIGVFIHHNTLHAFEHLPFEEAVAEAWRLFGAEPYLPEEAYRDEMRKGRVEARDIDAALEDEPDLPILPQYEITRRSVQHAILNHGLRPFTPATIEWHLSEGQLLSGFRPDLDSRRRTKLLHCSDGRDAERVAAECLFSACLQRVVLPENEETTGAKRVRDRLLAAAGVDLDEVIHPYLIRFMNVFLDQGLAYWPMPDRELGFYSAIRKLLVQPLMIEPRRLTGLRKEFLRQGDMGLTAADAVGDFMQAFRVAERDWEQVLRAELLALPGWAGLMRRLEQEPNLLPHATVPCSLMDFLAVRLTLTKVAAHNIALESGLTSKFPGDWEGTQAPIPFEREGRLCIAARLYDAAQLLGLSWEAVSKFSDVEFQRFQAEVERLHGLECRRLLHQAYERAHERLVLQPLGRHRLTNPPRQRGIRPRFQVFFCLDEREESMRRHIEELDTGVETFGAAGFYGIAVDYTGIDDSHGVPLCPVVVKPRHAVRERPVPTDEHLQEKRRSRRALWSRLLRGGFVSSRTLVRGWLSTAALGVLSLMPLIARVLAPRRFARLANFLNGMFLPEPRTELSLMRMDKAGHEAAEGLMLGFSIEEKVGCVESVLGPAGLRTGFARLVVVLGHGSTSLNNPHESAHDCGACGGRRGGPNGRLFAAMANIPEVREGLRAQGIEIPSDTWFLGGYHDTCTDAVDLFDLEQVPATHAEDLAYVRELLDRARARNAHERSRRFEAANPNESPELALLHVEERAEHLAEPRPEYGHCTNASTFVGRRAVTRGLFMDRRAFLVSYDPNQDPEDKDLGRLLAAAVPVCAGISLEYYFSFVDNERYGCGTKLPHNVAGLVGVMNGHASDLRTGLPWQMVEIHEPVRNLFIIETTPKRLMSVVRQRPSIHQLLVNRWIRLATLDPLTGEMHAYRDGRWEAVEPLKGPIPTAPASAAWYGGKIEHLESATITAGL